MELGLGLGFGFWIKSGAAEAHDSRIYPTVCAQTRTPTAKEDNHRRPTHSPQATLTHTQSLFSLWLTRTDQQRRQEMQTGGVRLEISISKSLLFMEGWTAHCTHAHGSTHTCTAAVRRIQKEIYCSEECDSYPPGPAVSTEALLFFCLYVSFYLRPTSGTQQDSQSVSLLAKL